MRQPLIMPRGIRFPDLDEVPGGIEGEVADRIRESYRTEFAMGFTRVDREDGIVFTTVFEANVHASSLWEIFNALVRALLPEVAAPIIGEIDEAPTLGRYTSREAALAVLEPYADMLANDGFLEFGCMFQHRGVTEEIFVPSSKYLRVWTNTPDRVTVVFRAHEVPFAPALVFLDNFPLVREPLPYAGEVAGFRVVLEELREKFLWLPDAPPPM